MSEKRRTLPASKLRELAVTASVDPRTVAAVLNHPGPVRTLAQMRALAALVNAGLLVVEDKRKL